MWSCKWDYKWRHSMAPTSCMLHKQCYMHARAWTRASIRTQICNTYCFSMATMIRERASVLRCTCIACLLITVNKCVTVFAAVSVRRHYSSVKQDIWLLTSFNYFTSGNSSVWSSFSLLQFFSCIIARSAFLSRRDACSILATGN
jgi:hypothetical protein